MVTGFNIDSIINFIKAIVKRANDMASKITQLGLEHGCLLVDLRELLKQTEGVKAEVSQAQAVLQLVQTLALNSLFVGPHLDHQQEK